MKKLLSVLIALTLCLSASALANETISIGATSTPHAIILEFIKDDYAKLGYDLDVQVFTDYFIGNPTTAAGEFDANYFQHMPFLVDYNKTASEEDQLVAVIAVHCEPYGIYAGTKAKLEDIAEGDSIAITNDPSNMTRALLLLSDAGLITLPEGSDFSSTLTPADIVENKLKLDILEMNAELITAALGDVAFAVINGNYAIDAGLSVAEDALFTEAEGYAGQAYINYVVVNPEDAEAEWVLALKGLLQSDKVRDFILTNESFAGGVVPAFGLE